MRNFARGALRFGLLAGIVLLAAIGISHAASSKPKVDQSASRTLTPVVGPIRSWADLNLWVNGNGTKAHPAHPLYAECYHLVTHRDVYKDIKIALPKERAGWKVAVSKPAGTVFTNSEGFDGPHYVNGKVREGHQGDCREIPDYTLRRNTARVAGAPADVQRLWNVFLTLPGASKHMAGKPVALEVCGNPVLFPPRKSSQSSPAGGTHGRPPRQVEHGKQAKYSHVNNKKVHTRPGDNTKPPPDAKPTPPAPGPSPPQPSSSPAPPPSTEPTPTPTSTSPPPPPPPD